ncbi:hypothetical protein NPIL_637051 [Nephila pilipes]|uniref:Uncharacterized protein n=1 Tax=Nephila pilipes TaxID=299642 RepID=A0A8X6JVL0_NEPPI|nr:hypothetical protein NPIL_637051 [Nephila pilipes]
MPDCHPCSLHGFSFLLACLPLEGRAEGVTEVVTLEADDKGSLILLCNASLGMTIAITHVLLVSPLNYQTCLSLMEDPTHHLFDT